MTVRSTPSGFLFDETSPVSPLRPGTRVEITTSKNVVDWPYIGKRGTLLGFARPHGFAIVKLDEGDEHVFHPDGLREQP